MVSHAEVTRCGHCIVGLLDCSTRFVYKNGIIITFSGTPTISQASGQGIFVFGFLVPGDAASPL